MARRAYLPEFRRRVVELVEGGREETRDGLLTLVNCMLADEPARSANVAEQQQLVIGKLGR
jgi:hypothetical protein